MKSDQIMIERTAASVVRSPIKPTAIKTILFHVHNDDQLQDRLQVALTLCRAFGAHLHLLHVVPLQAYTVVDAFGTFVSSQIVEVLENEAVHLVAGRVDRDRREERIGIADDRDHHRTAVFAALGPRAIAVLTGDHGQQRK